MRELAGGAVAIRGALDPAQILDHLAARLVGGVERLDGHRYTRTLRYPSGPGLLVVDVTATPAWSGASPAADENDAAAARGAVGRLLDADRDLAPVRETLGAHPWLGPLVAARPDLRSPGQVDGFEVLIRAVLGQQVSLKAAVTHTTRLARGVGTALGSDGARPASPDAAAFALTHLFPTPAQVLADGGAHLAMPARRVATVLACAEAATRPWADGGVADALDGQQPPDAVERRLLALPGIGPWTTQYLRMRALGDPDAYCGTDLVARRAAESLAGGPVDPRGADLAPWRSYATHHLWRHAALG